MDRFQSELQRLYSSPGGGQARAMVVELSRPASWGPLARVWRGVQADLDLPAPAIAVSGSEGYQLWFSLAEPVPEAQAIAFLESLRRRYLADIAAERVSILPAADALVPGAERTPGRWSAFVAPDLAVLFADEPWLDLSPGADAQADLLSRLQGTTPQDWKRALERLGTVDLPAAAQGGAAASPAGSQDAKTFLRAVMNDASIDMHLRIEAAKALLPWS